MGRDLVGRARTVARSLSHARELRNRRPPALTVDPAGHREATAYYLTPDEPAPSGGVRVSYRHVDALNAMGIPAAVVHRARGFRCTWFTNQTRVVSAHDLTLTPDDVLVVPEYYAPGFDQLPRGPRTIVFNQGAYYTFEHVPFDSAGPGEPYVSVPNLQLMMTVSKDSEALLRFTFPGVPIATVRNVVDESVFRPPHQSAGRRISYVARRRPVEREFIRHLLRSRGLPPGWELVPIEGCTEQETADIMRGSAIFLSFSDKDGFGMPPAEAMACGCLVIGFTGMGGRDYFRPEYSIEVPDGDVLAMGQAIEESISLYEADREAFAERGRLASKAILGHYHEEGLRDDLAAVVRPLVAGSSQERTPSQERAPSQEQMPSQERAR